VTALFAVTLIWVLPANAVPPAKFGIVHAFGSGTDGGALWGSLTFDSHGNLYGTTGGGGTNGGWGTVFELVPNGNGTWSETILHSFDYPDPNGSQPHGNVVLDSAGNVYGTATSGGAYDSGTVFELMPNSGEWTIVPLYSFMSGAGCGGPYAGPTMDKSGNLYGDAGCIFELSPGGSAWTESVLYQPIGDSLAGVALDGHGNLYGTTSDGGAYQLGQVYEVARTQTGWSPKILDTFDNANGGTPGLGRPAIDSAGNVYGATVVGGANGYGTIFELVRQPGGKWQETILYSFQNGPTGWGPAGGVAIDKAGNIFGTTINGGSPACGCGVIFELSKGTGGVWTYTVLHTFHGADGAQPDANVTLNNGKVYGTTITGGPYGAGVVFEVTP
jgi:uncharacterized repeat protein (TIGR03803 family)